MSENMLFCLGDGRTVSKGEGYQKNYRIFNVDVDKDTFSKAKNSIPLKLDLTAWVDKKMMTDEEKENHSDYKTVGGYLKVLSYEEAWAVQWGKYSEEEKKKFLDLPNFDPEIFKEITGIDLKKEVPSLKGKKVKVELDGVSYEAIIQ